MNCKNKDHKKNGDVLPVVSPGKIKELIFLFLLTVFFQSPPLIYGQEITLSGELNCINSSVRLNYYNVKAGSIYRWAGPGGYLSTAQSPETSIPGEYRVKITEPGSDKIISAHVIVKMDTVAPEKVRIDASGMLTCKDTLVYLEGHPSQGKNRYEWLGPNGFTLSGQKVVTKIPGIYALKVVDTVNGCFSKTNIKVRQDLTPPEDVHAFSTGELNCINTKIRLSGKSSDKHDVLYKWIGPDGYSSTESEPEISRAGNYFLTVEKRENGCKANANVVVNKNVAPPQTVDISISDTLTCRTKFVQVTGSSETDGVIFTWSGPGNFIADESVIKTNTPGKYTVIATDPANGCTIKKSAEVVENIIHPDDFSFKVSGNITCKDTLVTVNTYSSHTGLEYLWIGPGKFESKKVSPVVSLAGEYLVSVNNPSTGCSISKSVDVFKDTEPPLDVNAVASGALDCKRKSVTLKGSSKDKNVNYSWKGPGDFESAGQEVETTIEGNYELKVVNPENGCFAKKNLTLVNKCTEL
jgi:hypothetical protein